MDKTRCGFVAVLGLPNAGKSTLTNSIVGSKVSIVSPKVQTTRCQILGIHLYKESQIVFIDTPGIFEAKKVMDRAMVKTAFEACRGSDVIVYIIDVTRRLSKEKEHLIKLSHSKAPLFVLLNKIDLLDDKMKALAIEKEIRHLFPEDQQPVACFLTRATHPEDLQPLVDRLVEFLPESPWLYSKDRVSTISDEMFASEVTREQLYHQLQHELPYSAYVEPESFETFSDGSLKIHQSIVVARDSQKGIVVGKRGTRIKELSQKSREELTIHFSRPVHLFLNVKVKENWMDRSEIALRAIGIT